MVEAAAWPRWLRQDPKPPRASLTTRILAVNLIPLALLGGSLFFLDTYRRQLLHERFKMARIEAQITAEALAGASRSRQEALLVQIGKEQRMRLRMYDAEGRLWADNFALARPSYTLVDPGTEPFRHKLARTLDRVVDFTVGAPPLPLYRDLDSQRAEYWPELTRARRQGLTQITLRYAPDRTPVITAAAPVGVKGSSLLTTRNARDITLAVRSARQTLFTIFAFSLAVSIVLSLYLARTIIEPLRKLVRATVRVRLGRDREVEVPRMNDRGDEIGVLARAVSDMTSALRVRIDAVESFAADVAHEIKNPLASLRSAVETLTRVNDPHLRDQLIEVAAHDVRRIDRLVSEISEASRIDAELSRAKFEPVDMAALAENVIQAREGRGQNLDRRVMLRCGEGKFIVAGVPLRLERVIDNLLDNAVSFSPPGGVIQLALEQRGKSIRLTACDEGPGIPQKEREKVFTRFHSVRPETESFGNHSGLGLAIGRSIAEAHDGSLIAQDRPDGRSGACLALELPAA
ncbi:ATP-binding protein [Altericroceibacterium xinjiangense]|uniref:ATP-binding protein n=1 Tax=Altericroceibacterium xinjiangense TaxID=762261 RepID=UPI000F7F9B4A|nr:ATP-binding protein [Altericroceibacterium xinjiangense]